MVSAFTFDNVKTYDTDLKEAVVVNALGLGDDVARIKLTSPLNVQVGRGYQKVAEFNLTYYLDDNGGLDKIDFYNMKDSMKTIDREFDFKIKTIEEYSVNDYETICVASKDIKNDTEVCTPKLIGTHLKTRIVWNDFDEKTLLKSKEVTIGIFTNVEKGDVVEWIPTFYGVEISEWAAWTESLNVGLNAYYDFNGNVLDSSGSGNDGANFGSADVTGFLGNGSREFDGTDNISVGTGLAFTDAPFSVNMWINASSLAYYDGLMGANDTGGWSIYVDNEGDLIFGKRGGLEVRSDNTARFTTGTWQMATVVYNTTGVAFYKNGAFGEINTTMSETFTADLNYVIGAGSGDTYNGRMDEVGVWNRSLTPSEITDLYNGGTGISPSDAGITLNSPDNETTVLSGASTLFNATASSAVGETLVNMTLYIDSAVNETKSLTGIKDTETFTKSFSVGTYEWNIGVCYNTGTCQNSTIRSLTIQNYVENSQTYPTSSAESATETYTANLTYVSSVFSIITGVLTINGTEYLGARTGTGDSAILTASAVMPSIETETNFSANFSAYWTISLTNATATTDYNLTSHNVTVQIINLSLCDAVNNVPFWNFTILNESNAAEINSSFEATFTVFSIGSSSSNEFSYSDTDENKTQYDFCISPGTESYSINTAIKLEKTGYVTKFYNYEEIVVTNATREDNLYMLATEDSTSFIIHVVDVSARDITDAEVRVLRYYPGTNEWLVTEIVTTDDAGESVAHLLSEDADYKFQVYQSGVSTHNSSATKIVCAVSPCTVTLIIPISVATGIEVVEDLTSTLIYSSTTNTFTYTYSDSSGIFSVARLYVARVSPSNATVIMPCNETKLTISGVMSCDITGQVNGTYRASGYITRDSDEFLNLRIDGALGTNVYNSMGDDGLLWAFFIFIGIAMLGVARPSLAIVFGTVGLITVGLLQIVNIGALSIVAVSAVAVILLMRVGRE